MVSLSEYRFIYTFLLSNIDLSLLFYYRFPTLLQALSLVILFSPRCVFEYNVNN